MSDRALIETARRFASGDEHAKRLQEIGEKVRKAMEEYVRAAEMGELPEDVVQEMVDVWTFVGIVLAHYYRTARLYTKSRARALTLFIQLFSPLGLALIGERLRDLLDLIELEEHFRRRGEGGERTQEAG
ncbi:MAG: hypothetical protein LM580_10190 [Thermofilum sp.]|nr:hypothetical protein [Thermofilum sp.]